MLIATAGHIDHGKTALVRALTGVETDRLPEEQVRGISIDLGFAYWRPDGDEIIGFIDVPGHERFLRTMIAGVSGIDLALLVVSAEDGIMPQTVEHLRVLELLGVPRGMAVLNKCDRADPARIEQVRGAVAALLAEGPFAGSPLFEVSATTGAGIAALATALIAARDARQPQAGTGQGFRLAVDRTFTVDGAGTVVTGTVVAGQVTAGDRLTLSPAGQAVRVRSVQIAGAVAQQVSAGQRCALNLAGLDRSEVHRGDWLVHPALHAPTRRIEARIGLLPGCSTPLRHDARVHLHLGAADLGARVLIPHRRAILPGERAVVSLVLDQPTTAASGQHLLLRDSGACGLLGGGLVLDPLASERRRPAALREAMAEALALRDPATALAALAAIPGCEPDLDWFALARGLMPDTAANLLAAGDLVAAGKAGRIVVTPARLDRLGDALVAALGAHHAAHADRGGMSRREARAALGEPVSVELFASLLQRLGATRRIETDGALVRLPGHSARFSQAETALWQAARAALQTSEPRPIVVAELVRELRASEAAIRAMLYRRRVAGQVWQVSEKRFMLREHVAALAAVAARLASAEAGGFTAAQFRDASGLGRNFVIELLEFFDRIGVTLRHGERRRMRRDHEGVVGAANAATPP
ncbi:MAG: selenocysteine-specific translation elongation factor [Sphingomonadales bacterium]|nr:selenocysteine-specific translation elongation factor [Sphingomonadales bacterium]